MMDFVLEATAWQFLSTAAVAICTLVAYSFLFGIRHQRQRADIQEQLREAEMRCAKLQQELEAVVQDEHNSNPDKVVRVWLDGAFDMMHYGHMNAFRQGRSHGTYLIVGVNSDESILKCKGPPVQNNQERIEAVRACKWVDEVVENVPYVLTPDYLEKIVKDMKIDYVVHGDDPCIVDGKDVYAHAKAMGWYRSIPRTEGVSTTDIVGRMLLMTKDHHTAPTEEGRSRASSKEDLGKMRVTQGGADSYDSTFMVRRSKFLTTNKMLRLFSAGFKEPKEGMRIVYMDGAWDMFHAGHASSLRKARELGDYLICGVHNDQLVNKKRGSNMPIMSLHERVLSVLGCSYVDDVLIDAPEHLTKEMMASLNISIVAHGSRYDGRQASADPYGVAKEGGIFREVNSTMTITVEDLCDRIRANEARFRKKVAIKAEAEDDYYQKRYFGKPEKEESLRRVKSSNTPLAS